MTSSDSPASSSRDSSTPAAPPSENRSPSTSSSWGSAKHVDSSGAGGRDPGGVANNTTSTPTGADRQHHQLQRNNAPPPQHHIHHIISPSNTTRGSTSNNSTTSNTSSQQYGSSVSSASGPPSSGATASPVPASGTSGAVNTRPNLDPHNNGARAALTNEIRSEFFRLYEQADFQIPGLNTSNILRHKDKDLHFEGHEGLRDFWKQTAATRREILQLAREGRIRVVRGPHDQQPPPQTSTMGPGPANASSSSSGSSHPQMITPQPMLLTPEEGSAFSTSPNSGGDSGTPGQTPAPSHNSRKRQATSSSDDSSTTAATYKRSSQIGLERLTSDSTMNDNYRVAKFVATVQRAVKELGGPGDFPSESTLERIASLEKERDEALRARDAALEIAQESYRELRAVVESRGRRIKQLKDDGGNGND